MNNYSVERWWVLSFHVVEMNNTKVECWWVVRNYTLLRWIIIELSIDKFWVLYVDEMDNTRVECWWVLKFHVDEMSDDALRVFMLMSWCWRVVRNYTLLRWIIIELSADEFWDFMLIFHSSWFPHNIGPFEFVIQHIT
jgi:hypothetical protein